MNIHTNNRPHDRNLPVPHTSISRSHHPAAPQSQQTIFSPGPGRTMVDHGGPWCTRADGSAPEDAQIKARPPRRFVPAASISDCLLTRRLVGKIKAIINLPNITVRISGSWL
ncbi:hypothetical protein JYU34_016176 [Plutella xylostella]|uniref:Uncharacterized protein n=1 Tax=Plutella xylostella TaxID=51655 RepID=A0ABQ7Q5L8_PLUXY|nr:hypothetical protein JYU34_016176 [Plutella xylostella]